MHMPLVGLAHFPILIRGQRRRCHLVATPYHRGMQEHAVHPRRRYLNTLKGLVSLGFVGACRRRMTGFPSRSRLAFQ